MTAEEVIAIAQERITKIRDGLDNYPESEYGRIQGLDEAHGILTEILEQIKAAK